MDTWTIVFVVSPIVPVCLISLVIWRILKREYYPHIIQDTQRDTAVRSHNL